MIDPFQASTHHKSSVQLEHGGHHPRNLATQQDSQEQAMVDLQESTLQEDCDCVVVFESSNHSMQGACLGSDRNPIQTMRPDHQPPLASTSLHTAPQKAGPSQSQEAVLQVST